MIALLALLLFGGAVIGTVAMLRLSQVADVERQRLTYRLDFPRGVKAAQVQAFLTALSGRRIGREGFVFEITATRDGLTHNLTVPSAASAFVLAQLRAAIPGVRVTRQSDEPSHYTWGRELRLTNGQLPLRTDDPAATATSLLAAVAPVSGRNDEWLTVQWVVTPARQMPRVVAAKDVPPRALDRTRINRPGLSNDELQQLRRKHDLPLFVGAVRLGVSSEPGRRPVQLIARPLAALRSVRVPGATFRLRLLPPSLVARRVAGRRLPSLVYPVTVNAGELTALLGWPLDSPAVPGLHLGASPQLPVPRQLPSRGLVIGQATYPSMERPIAISHRDALRHIYVPGATGVGKSTLALNLVLQQINAGYGVAVFDPKGDLCWDVLERIPPELAERVVVVDPTDSRPVGLNLLDGPASEADLTADQVTGVFARRFASGWGFRTDDICRAAILTLLTDSESTLVDLPTILLNSAFRRRLVGRIADPALRQFWQAFEAWSEAEKAHNVAPLLNKARAVLLRKSVRGIIGQPSTITFDQVLRERRVLLVPLQAGLVGSDAAALLGGLIFARLWAAVQRRAAIPATARVPFFVTLDEFQTLIEDMPTPPEDVLALARGYAFPMTLLHQNLAQLRPETRQGVLANCRTKIAFNLSAPDATVLAREFGYGLDASALVNLGRYEVVIGASVETEQLPPTTAVTLPPPAVVGQGAAIRARSRERYGRDLADVERIQAERMTGPADEPPTVGRKRL